MVIKRKDSVYSGLSSRDWLKVRTSARGQFRSGLNLELKRLCRLSKYRFFRVASESAPISIWFPRYLLMDSSASFLFGGPQFLGPPFFVSDRNRLRIHTGLRLTSSLKCDSSASNHSERASIGTHLHGGSQFERSCWF